MQLRHNPSLKGESYCLSVSKTNVIIEAARPVGFFYALQTLKQMLPTRAVMAGVSVEKGTSMTLPVVEIEDAPRSAGAVLCSTKAVISSVRKP